MDKHKDNILIVDDTKANVRLLMDLLENGGYRVRPALCGKTALKAAEAEMPDLVLLDIVMPEMDGYEVCRKLKENISLKDVPVIFISALGEISDKVKGFSVGGVDYIIKPFHTEEVLARVATHLTIRRLRQELEWENTHLEKTNKKLSEALEEIRNLRSILPICCHCKKIRDDQGYWEQLEIYLDEHSGIEFTHSICPKCARDLYPDFPVYEED